MLAAVYAVTALADDGADDAEAEAAAGFAEELDLLSSPSGLVVEEVGEGGEDSGRVFLKSATST
jgi:hypothetical protein